jgi:hypothetical protein
MASGIQGAALAATAGAWAGTTLAAESADAAPRGKAEHCIFLWLGGGASQIDTWDPKRRGDGKKQAGSYYDPIPTAIEGVQVCEHLPRCADLLDRFILLRTVHHEVINEHAAAVNRMHTGRPTSGTIVYPSIGSIVAHQKGAAQEAIPPYVVVGYPNVTRGPGFLGAKAGYLYLTDTKAGPPTFRRPEGVSPTRQQRREALLQQVRDRYESRREPSPRIESYDQVIDAALRLSGPEFMRVFQLEAESDTLRNAYGGEFGQRCLLARRLIQSGTRFVEVSHNLNFVNGTGWDTHNEGQLNQHLLIKELDQALSSLVTDLETHHLLDKTLIVVGTEFGRPPKFDAGGGRGHHSKAFSIVLAGGGLKTGQVIGQTDELGRNPVSQPISVPDLHATIHAALGINPGEELYDGNRPVPITDGGRPIAQLFG